MASIEDRARSFISVLRHCQVLGITVEQADEKGLVLRLPYSESIVGNPVTGVVHGGAITTLMDTCCGISTVCFLPEFEICPTLDLRIDYMRPADPNKAIFGFAECYRITPAIIFTRGVAYQSSKQEPIAHVVGTFMRMGKPDKQGQLSRTMDGGAA
ncbi:MAG TPA: PaaI family thioesterase [Pseudomonas xinjiangensis]|uniref:PaaI family thioesterase n=2 Tax=root TaxID=1 RepID=A0A7V1FQA9_9GAMM|nr:PaaI family thioesterase [Halopseudomonas xinjiangensis]HEC47422.1 PaaI family thioesterase [Halopseudomonas xinjiangensis]